MRRWAAFAGVVTGVVVVGVSASLLFRNEPSRSDGVLIEAAATCPDRETVFVEHYECLGDVLVSVIDADGAGQGVAVMHALVLDDPLMASACHQAAHHAGRQSRNVVAVQSILEVEDGTCDFGLTHGAMESLSDIEDDVVFDETITSICDASGEGVRRYNCAHGIGHALALRELRTLDGLIRRCATLQAADQDGCVTASVMVYQSNKSSFSEDVAVEMPRIANEDLPTVCESVNGDAERSCWQMLASMLDWGDRGGVVEQITLICERAGERGYRDECSSGYGQGVYFRLENAGDLDPAVIERNFIEAVDQCPSGSMYEQCIAGVSGGVASFWSAERDNFDKYPDLCGRLDLSLRKSCLVPEQLWRDTLSGLGRDQ